jgi:hypothetical protein
MKFTSWLAMGALIGRKIAPGEDTWKDKALKALIAKNEVMDRDGMVRGYLRKEINAELSGEADGSREVVEKRPKSRGIPGGGAWANFVDGFWNG